MNTLETYKILKEKYVDKGLKIFPIIENGKTPMIPNWQNDCSYSVLQIMYWLENAPTCNWGLPCTPNDLFVVDVDVHNINGLLNMKQLLTDLDIKELCTLSQKTPSGGLHLIFKSDDELKKVANSSNSFEKYPGIDIRTDGYIVCNPSIIDGKMYEMGERNVGYMPQKLKDFILSQTKIIKTDKKDKKEYELPESVEEGGRDVALFEYINNIYFKTRLTRDEIEVLANNFNQKVCDPPLPQRQVNYKINKVFKKDRGKLIFLKLSDLEDEEDVSIC